MSRLFYGWEFLEDGVVIHPVSVGMVRESDGEELYLVNQDMPVDKIKAHPFLSKNVWPQLPLIKGNGQGALEASLDVDDPRVQPLDVIATRVRRFIADTPNVSLWAWHAAYDHVALARMYGPMADLPSCIPQRTNDLAQEAERLGNPRLPEQPGGLHNALEDARHNMVRAHALDRIAEALAAGDPSLAEAHRFDSDPQALAWARTKIQSDIDRCDRFRRSAAMAGDVEQAETWRRLGNRMSRVFIGGSGKVALFDERLAGKEAAVSRDSRTTGKVPDNR